MHFLFCFVYSPSNELYFCKYVQTIALQELVSIFLSNKGRREYLNKLGSFE